MSSATARFFTLPLRYLHLYRPSLLLLSSPRVFLSRSPPPRSTLHLPRRFHFNTYAQAQTTSDDQFHDYSPSSTSASDAGVFSPWPEWLTLINSFQFSRYFDRLHGNLGFVNLIDDGASLPGDFFRSVNACLAFAREHESLLWSLSRKDIETVVENGSPFLFKDEADTMRRMKLFVSGSIDHVIGGEKPSTVDVMKFLLSYASTTFVSSETFHFHNRENVEWSVRRLFSQLAEISGAPASASNQFLGTGLNEQLQSYEQSLQMKRGDWVCPRCRFMNFARNMKCLECEETRPKRVLTGGEWECPQCDFFNYGRNTACLRCDCKKPSISKQDQVPTWLRKISQLENASNQGNFSADKVFAETVSKEGSITNNNTIGVKLNPRFNKILEQSTNPAESASSPYDDFPENMPTRKGETSFVIRERKDRSLTSPIYKRRVEMEQSKKNNYVPFVPFPPNHFARDQQPLKHEPEVNYDQQQQSFDENRANQQSWNQDYPQQTQISQSFDYQRPTRQSFDQNSEQPMTNQQSWNQDYPQQTRTSQSFDDHKPAMRSFDQNNVQPMANQRSWNQDQEVNSSSKNRKPDTESFNDQKTRLGQWRGSSLEGSAVKEEPDPLDMSEEAKAERWFKRVAQIKDIKELSEIPDEDFPSIMPMRKGVNRFVVSKRKTPLERRLASSQYRRNLPVVKSDPIEDNGDGEN